MNYIDRKFEDMAIGVLEVFDKSTRDNVQDVLVIRYIESLKMDCLELAVHCDCVNFVSNSIVQRILDNIWEGKEYKTDQMVKSCNTFYRFNRVNFID